MKDQKEYNRIHTKKRYDGRTSEERSQYNAYKRKYYKNMSKKQKKEHSNRGVLNKRAYHLMKVYGITVDQYNTLFLKQEGKCLICGKHQRELKMTLRIDHDHNTGKIRGLLCHGCNTAIGLLNEDIDIFKRAIQYLELKSSNCLKKLIS